MEQHFNFEEEDGQATAGGCRGLLGLCCWVGSLILNLDHLFPFFAFLPPQTFDKL